MMIFLTNQNVQFLYLPLETILENVIPAIASLITFCIYQCTFLC